MEPLVCAVMLSGICSSIRASSGSAIPVFRFTRWYFDLRSVPWQPWLLEGFEGRGTSLPLWQLFAHKNTVTKICAISKFSIYHSISLLYSRGLLRRWRIYFRYIKMTRYTSVFSSHKSLWNEWSSWDYYLWPSMEISEYGIRSFLVGIWV